MTEDERATNGPAVDDARRISRRRAIQGAAAGAAAVAVWSAPRIEGLSLAQDTAAAASCTAGNYSSTLAANGSGNCWDDLNNNTCTTVALPAFTSNSAHFSVSGNAAGDFGPAATGSTTITVNGIDPPFEPCTVTVSGGCSGGKNFTSNANGGNTLNASGSLNFNANCSGSSNADLTVAVSCACL
jgi:hypothetical protein